MSSKLNLTEPLKNPGQEYPFEADTTLDTFEVMGDVITFEGITVKGTVVASGDSVSLNAASSAIVHAHCSRCLEPVEMPIQAEVIGNYVRELDPDDPDQYYYEASELDVTDAVRDALMLELPLRFLCKEDCKGLCPKCGINLNTGSCACAEEIDDLNPFAALRSIVENNEEV